GAILDAGAWPREFPLVAALVGVMLPDLFHRFFRCEGLAGQVGMFPLLGIFVVPGPIGPLNVRLGENPFLQHVFGLQLVPDLVLGGRTQALEDQQEGAKAKGAAHQGSHGPHGNLPPSPNYRNRQKWFAAYWGLISPIGLLLLPIAGALLPI